MNMSYHFSFLGTLLVALSVLIPITRALSWHIDKTELYLRVRTWWVIVAVILVAGLSQWSLHLLIGALISGCLYELAIIHQIKQRRRWLLPVLLSVALQISIAFAQMSLALALLLTLIAVLYWFSKELMFSAKRCLYIATSTGCVIALSALSLLLSADSLSVGQGNLLFLVFICQANDVAQYCWGKSLGKKKISPILSPNKTWAGFIGGLLTLSIVGGFLGPKMTALSVSQSMVAAALICISGFFGDLSVSALKRHFQIRNTGTLLPGHGGMGDRVDSLLLSSWIFYGFMQLVA